MAFFGKCSHGESCNEGEVFLRERRSSLVLPIIGEETISPFSDRALHLGGYAQFVAGAPLLERHAHLTGQDRCSPRALSATTRTRISTADSSQQPRCPERFVKVLSRERVLRDERWPHEENDLFQKEMRPSFLLAETGTHSLRCTQYKSL